MLSASWESDRTRQWLYYWYNVLTDKSWDFTRQHRCLWCSLWTTVTARTATGKCFQFFCCCL